MSTEKDSRRRHGLPHEGKEASGLRDSMRRHGSDRLARTRAASDALQKPNAVGPRGRGEPEELEELEELEEQLELLPDEEHEENSDLE